MKMPLCSLLLLTAACVAVFASGPGLASGDDWRAIDPAELASKTPTVDKNADAEAIFWEVRVDDGDPGELVFTNYVRVKVYTDRGKESQSQIDLEYYAGSKIKDISARTIKPDGAIIEVTKDDVHDRTIVKGSGVKLKAKSFAMPAVEPGAIVEYRWREVWENIDANYIRLPFQRDIPTRSVIYLVRPYKGPNSMLYRTFHMPQEAKFEKAKDGFYRVSLSNSPAFHEEPRMPPDDSVRAWILLFYSAEQKIEPEKFWDNFGKRLYEITKDEMKVNDEVRRTAIEIIGNAAAPEEKLRRIYEYCQTKIKNISRDSSLTAEERTKLGKEIKSPADTLKRGMGKGSNIDALFAALATAAGFDAREVFSGNRQNIFLDQQFPNPYFLLRGSSFIGVRLGETWRFFSPAETYTPFGMLGWREEGQKALVADKDPAWIPTPLSPPDKSSQRSSGKFRLLEDGTLEGDARVEYTGQWAIDKKEYNGDDSAIQRESNLRESFKTRMSTAEISAIKIENVTDPIEPFIYSYHIRVPGYAQRTGKRLFLQPAFFEHGLNPMFTASQREHQIYFHYPWSEAEDLEIELPQGFALDNADAPASFSAGPVSKYGVKISISNDGRRLIYHRDFFFGGNGSILFPESAYGQLRQYFDQVHKNDEHTLALKQSPAGGN